MKVIIAGGRNFNDYELLKAELNILIVPTIMLHRNIEVVSGTAKGADQLGERYAKEYNLLLKQFPADWDKYGKSAGYYRNKQMADYATHCVCFWDGISKGTKMMIDLAKAANLKVQVYNIEYQNKS